MKEDTTLLIRVKERVEFIYGLVTEREGGYTGGFTSQDQLTKMCVRALVDRGALNRVQAKGHARLTYNYTWAARLAPTKEFYKNIAQDVHNKYASAKKKSKDNKKQNEPIPTVEERPGKSTDYYVLEYSEAQGGGVFHFNLIREKEDGRRYTESMLYLNGYNPIAIIPSESINNDLFERVVDFSEKNTGRRFSRSSIVRMITHVVPKKYMWSMKGLDVSFEDLVDEKTPKATFPALSVLLGEDEEPKHEPQKKEDRFAKFTSQELWDELKNRGFSIEDGRLVQIVKSYLD